MANEETGRGDAPAADAPRSENTHRPCLSEAEVQALSSGALDGAARATAQAHLEGCADCRQLVAQLANQLAAPASALSGGAPPERGSLVGRYVVTAVAGAGAMATVYRANDPRLDRNVALKLLHGTRTDVEGEERLRREAQTMARLAHPNVVRVYDVGEHAGCTFLAMEFVEGVTLRRWLAQASPPRDRIVEVFLGAGRGLAAAHDAAVLHRDFKPDNVLVADDGRVLVGDFGLASTPKAPAQAETKPPTSSDDATTSTGVMGTPAYLAPELRHGSGPATAASDQYAYCLSFWEALVGTRPDAGDRASARRVPAGLRRLLTRGLEPDPSARFPSMAVLLDELERWRRSQTRRRAWVRTTSAAAVLLGLAWGASRVDPCPPPSGRVDQVWSAARQQALRTRTQQLDPAHGLEQFARAARGVEAWLAAFQAQHVEACLATKRGPQPDAVLDLRMRCLDRRFSELSEAVTLMGEAEDQLALDSAVSATPRLTPPSSCGDVETLQRPLALPEAPEARAKAEQLLERVAALLAREHGSGLKGLTTAAEEVVAEARALNHPTVLTAALVELARARLAVGEAVAAQEPLREVTQVAALAHDDRAAAYAWTKLMRVMGWSLRRPEQASEYERAAAAALARAGDPLDLKVELLLDKAQVLTSTKVPEALATIEEAQALLERAGATRPGSDLAASWAKVLVYLANTRADSGDVTGAIADYERTLDAVRAVYGPDSREEAFTWHNLSEAYREDGKNDLALAAAQRALEIDRTRVGDSAPLADDLAALGNSLEVLGRFDEALVAEDEALALMRRTAPTGNPALIANLVVRANTLEQLGRPEEAARGYEEAIDLLEHQEAPGVNLPITLYNRGELYAHHGQCERALVDYERSLRLSEELRGKDGSLLAYPLVGQGRCFAVLGRYLDAIPTLTRALALPAQGEAVALLAQGRFFLAEARAATGQNRAEELKRAKEAQAEAIAAKCEAADIVLMEEVAGRVAHRR